MQKCPFVQQSPTLFFMCPDRWQSPAQSQPFPILFQKVLYYLNKMRIYMTINIMLYNKLKFTLVCINYHLLFLSVNCLCSFVYSYSLFRFLLIQCVDISKTTTNILSSKSQLRFELNFNIGIDIRCFKWSLTWIMYPCHFSCGS